MTLNNSDCVALNDEMVMNNELDVDGSSNGLIDMVLYTIWYDMIYYLTATGLTPVGSSTVHIYTQTIYRTTRLTNWEECGPCPVFASYTLAFALQLRGAAPLQAWSGPEGSRKLRFPDFLTTAQDGGKVVSLTHRPPLPPGNTPGTHFCYRLSRP